MKKTILIACMTASILIAGSAQATVQEDVSLCRAAFVEKTGKSIDDFRLKFESKKGNRVRTLEISAIPKGKMSGNKFRFSCVINRDHVTDIVIDTKDT